MKNKPAYSIESVDHALHLATILQLEGPLGVADAALRLGVARSTAHRLLAMLVYRDFAEQDASRRYLAGPVLLHPAANKPMADLRRLALPHLQILRDRVNETVNFEILTGLQVRFIATAECSRVLRVGDREGRMLPAHRASGGRAILSWRTDEEITALFSAPDSPVLDLDPLLRLLRRARRQGFAVNDQETEVGVTAVGRAVHVPPGSAGAAITVAMPTLRYDRRRLPDLVQHLCATVSAVEADFRASAVADSRPHQQLPAVVSTGAPAREPAVSGVAPGRR